MSAQPNGTHSSAADLKARVDLIQFAQAHGFEGRMSGRAFVTHAPYRDDCNPSLNIYSDGFIDRATGERGDVFEYVEKIGLASDFPSALEYIANWLILQPPLPKQLDGGIVGRKKGAVQDGSGKRADVANVV